MENKQYTEWFVYALTGNANTVIDWRCIHDKDKGKQGVNIRGSLAEKYDELKAMNDQGYGIFCNISAMDGNGSEYENVTAIRAHVVDLDDTLTAEANYQRAGATGSFAVQSSPGKYHVYWRVTPYVSNEFFTIQQRKLAALYGGDKSIIDATRVMRVPGFLHQKGEPQLVTGWNLTEKEYQAAEIQAMVAGVNLIDHASQRFPLGTKEKSAPSLDWVKRVMQAVNPNDMDRGEWLSFSAAIKQASWLHADPDTIYKMWEEWCQQYDKNNIPENLKLWNSLKDTEVGWKSMLAKAGSVKAELDFYGVNFIQDNPNIAPPAQATQSQPKKNQELTSDDFPEMIDWRDQKEYFKDCFYVEKLGQVFTKTGRFMNSQKFNGKYGGKQFIYTSTGKATDEAWKAATRSTVWTIPKVDHTRFLPLEEPFAIIRDDMKRTGVNTYIPASIEMREGDPSPWLNHLKFMIPDDGDRKIILDYMAHCIKFPGFKIPWSPMIQSAQGAGKSSFTLIMQAALGSMYVYNPNAQELVSSGSTFNAWMRNKLMIMVDEIKVDERRELVEVLKPMISEKQVEIQAKGQDQDMEDNLSNWFFFSNHKDAIPIDQNDRRYAIFYSALSNAADIAAHGLDKKYFDDLFNWLNNGGSAIMTYYFKNYPINMGDIDQRCPIPTTQAEAIKLSRSPMEVVVDDCIADGVAGFRGGYISSIALQQRCKAAGIKKPSIASITTCLEKLEYIHIGRAVAPYMQEDMNQRAQIFAARSDLVVEGYAKAQGYA